MTRSFPVISSDQATAYDSFTVQQHGDGRLDAITDVPPRLAVSREILERVIPSRITWDGTTIRITLDNGSWLWRIEAQSPDGWVLYGRWPD